MSLYTGKLWILNIIKWQIFEFFTSLNILFNIKFVLYSIAILICKSHSSHSFKICHQDRIAFFKEFFFTFLTLINKDLRTKLFYIYCMRRNSISFQNHSIIIVKLPVNILVIQIVNFNFGFLILSTSKIFILFHSKDLYKISYL